MLTVAEDGLTVAAAAGVSAVGVLTVAAGAAASTAGVLTVAEDGPPAAAGAEASAAGVLAVALGAAAATGAMTVSEGGMTVSMDAAAAEAQCSEIMFSSVTAKLLSPVPNSRSHLLCAL